VAWDPRSMRAELLLPTSSDASGPLLPKPLPSTRTVSKGGGKIQKAAAAARAGEGNVLPHEVEVAKAVKCLVPGCSSDSSQWTLYSVVRPRVSLEACPCAHLTRMHLPLQRSRVCGEHMRAESLDLPDGPRRFCQKCNRFHVLDKFDGSKRTCRHQLESFNARRRETNAIRKEKATRRSNHLKRSGDGSGCPAARESGPAAACDAPALARAPGDMVMPHFADTGAEPWDSVAFADVLDDDGDLRLGGEGELPLLVSFGDPPQGTGVLTHSERPRQSTGASGAAHPAFWWWHAPATAAKTVDVKMHGPHSPVELPAGLPAVTVGSAFQGDGSNAESLSLSGYVEPGCLLLTCEALLAVDHLTQAAPQQAETEVAGTAREQERAHRAHAGPCHDRVSSRSAADVLAALCAHPAAGVAPFLRSCSSVALCLDQSTASTAGGGPVKSVHHAARDTYDAAWLPCAQPAAALCTSPVAVTLRFPSAQLAAAWAAPGVRARFHGHFVSCEVAADFTPDGAGVVVQFPAVGVEGVVMIEPATAAPPSGESGQLAPRGPPAALVLTTSPELVAELNAAQLTAPLVPLQSTVSPPPEIVAHQFQHLRTRHDALVVLGHALRAGASPVLVARACSSSLRQGWTASVRRCIAALVDATPTDDAEMEIEPLLKCSLLHEAAASGQPVLLDAMMAARQEVIARSPVHGHQWADAAFGAPWLAGAFPGGYTPLHVCALAPAQGTAPQAVLIAAQRMLLGTGSAGTAVDGLQAAADSTVAWFSVSCNDSTRRATASQLAAARGPLDPLAELDKRLRHQLHVARRIALQACARTQEVDGIFIPPEMFASANRHLPPAAGQDGNAMHAWALAVAQALLRNASEHSHRRAVLAGAERRGAFTLSSAMTRLARASRGLVLGSNSRQGEQEHFQNAWRLAFMSWLVHLFFYVEVLYTLGSIVRWLRAPPLDEQMIRSISAVRSLSGDLEFPTMRWRELAPTGVLDNVATQGLPLEVAVTALLGACLMLDRPRVWLTTPGTHRVQALLFVQAAAHCCLVTMLMHMRSAPRIVAIRGAHLAWPLRSSVIMCAFVPFVFGCLPIMPVTAAPILAARSLLAVAAWARPNPWASFWPASDTHSLALQLAGCASAACIVLTREAWLRTRFEASSGKVKTA
jgi:SBP domain